MESFIGRRKFLATLGGAAVAWPLAVGAQQPDKLPTVGFLVPNIRSAATEWIDAFVLRMRELGWIEGRTVAIEYRWVEGRGERFAEIAAEFVQLKVNVIVTSGTPAVMALQQATNVIPIVFATAGDPVSTGLVASLARPGGHTTGLATIGDELAGKRLELLREAVPHLSRLALMGNVNNRFTVLEMSQVRSAAAAIGLEVTTLEIRGAPDITKAFEAVKGGADALYVCTDAAIIHSNRVQINTLAVRERLPTMHGARTYIEGGGLMSYGPNFPNMFRRSADFVDKILRGAKAGEIPVEQPTKFDLVVNLNTARALGVTVPDKLVSLADEVIE
jgi:putative tryptophan/tyrosine transport system substrate-binding protein